MSKEVSNTGKTFKSDPFKKDSRKTMKTAVWEMPFRKQNFILLALGLGVIILGYLLMATGITQEQALAEGAKWNNPMANTVAPILLFIGYCLLIPFAIIKFFGKSSDNNEGQSN